MKRFAAVVCVDVMLPQVPSWAVVATVDEPPALIQTFLAWHLSLGAAEVHLYFDRADDPAAALCDGLPGVFVTICDDAYWAQTGKPRPARHQVRQVRNARHASQRTEADWLLHIDADEFLWAEEPVSTCLSRGDQTLDAVVAPVAERFYDTGSIASAVTVLEGPFRKPFADGARQGRAMFGPDYDLTLRGLTGHVQGKSFVRRARKLNISIHRPGGADLRIETCAGITLLHFDGLTSLHWVYKLLRKADAFLNRAGMPPSRHRQRQIDAVLQTASGALGLHDRLKCLPPEITAQLRTENLYISPQFDPLASVARLFPEQQIDLSVQAMDAWLWHEKPDLLRSFGLKPR